MSLNGLDSPDVLEAHQAAIAEAGGWYVEIPRVGEMHDCWDWDAKVG